jgi:endonuclease/exonuclease/phosphatase family metal-dependent hydrolase
MKKNNYPFLIFSIFFFINCKPVELPSYKGDFDLSAMSFNLRYDTEEDGSNKWNNRKEACIKMLANTQPCILGIQEGLHHQVTYIKENLPQYNYVGVGRDDGYSAGEYSAIFYSTQRFELIKTGNFWLSETPNTPSKGWDANNIRIVTWVKLKDASKNKVIYVFNTHFDHKGKIAQKQSSLLLTKQIKQIVDDIEAPIFIMGDFNLLIGNNSLKPIIKEYYSARRFALRTDNNKSFNAWGKFYLLNRNIDYIFFKNANALSFKTIVKKYGVPYISDHYPIISHFNYN